LPTPFVAITGGLEDRVFAVPAEPVVIDQRGCWYVPRVAGAMTGQPVVFRSSDDTLHNVHGEPRTNARWNFGLPRPNSERTLVLENPEVMVPVRCDVHPWMRLDLGILPHPYFAVPARTGDSGSPTSQPARTRSPLGTRCCRAGSKPITVTAGGTTMVAVAFAAAGAGHAP
jgi:hypothetical protein